jgi:hypothetical protein
METGIESQDIAVAFRAGDVAVRGLVPIAVGLPDFVALGAGFSAGVAVVEAGAGEKEDREDCDEQGHYHAGAEEFAIVWRHLFTSNLPF